MSVPSEVIRVPACSIVNRPLSETPQACFCVLSNKLTAGRLSLLALGPHRVSAANAQRVQKTTALDRGASHATWCPRWRPLYSRPPRLSFALLQQQTAREGRTALGGQRAAPSFNSISASNAQPSRKIPWGNNVRFIRSALSIHSRRQCPTQKSRVWRVNSSSFVSDSRELRRSLFCPTWLISSRRARLAPLAKARSKRKRGPQGAGRRSAC